MDLGWILNGSWKNFADLGASIGFQVIHVNPDAITNTSSRRALATHML